MTVSQEKMSEAELQGQSKLRILVVEDDGPSREVLKEYASEHGDCDAVDNGAKAVEAFKDALDNGRPYNLICLDIMMPEMDGHAALRAIRQIEKDRGISRVDSVRIFMTSAKDRSSDMIQSFKEGCESYIIKPVAEEKLIAEMRKMNLIK